MKLNQIAAFREVMRTGTMSAAARNLSRSQPAISGLISSLEADIGVKLFTRDGGRLHPVPEAYYLLEEANQILGRLETATTMMKGIRSTDRGTIQIASMPGPSVFVLPGIVSDFVADRSEVSVSLTSRSSTIVHQLVASQQYDIGFADTQPDLQTETSLMTAEAYSFRCYCALHPDDPLARQEYISPTDLDGRPMAALYGDHPTRRATEDNFTNETAHFALRFEAQYFIPLLTYVEHRLANAIVDAITVEGYTNYCNGDAALIFRPFVPDIYLDTRLLMPRHNRRSHLSSAFVDVLRSRLKDIQRRYP